MKMILEIVAGLQIVIGLVFTVAFVVIVIVQSTARKVTVRHLNNRKGKSLRARIISEVFSGSGAGTDFMMVLDGMPTSPVLNSLLVSLSLQIVVIVPSHGFMVEVNDDEMVPSVGDIVIFELIDFTVERKNIYLNTRLQSIV